MVQNLIKREGQAVQIEDSAEVRTGSRKGKWLAWRYKCMMGNGNESHYKDRKEQLSLETLDSEERKGSGGHFSKVMQVTVCSGMREVLGAGCRRAV